VCCLVILQGKSALCFDCRGDGVDSDLTAFKGSSSPGHLPTSPLAMEEEASSNFIRTAKMERAALNGSHGFFVVTGKDIPSIPSYDVRRAIFLGDMLKLPYRNLLKTYAIVQTIRVGICCVQSQPCPQVH